MNSTMNRRLKRFLVLAILGSLAAVCTSAVALSANTSEPATNPLQGISAAASAPVGVSDTSARATLTSLEASVSGPLASQNLDQARLLTSAVSGHDLYVIPSTNGDLCVFLQGSSESCTSPLIDSHPATFSVVDTGGAGTGALVYGVAEDGVTTISFAVAGETETVPVQGNAFSYQAGSTVSADAITGAAATLAGGEVVSLG